MGAINSHHGLLLSASSGPAVTWNPSDKAANITLSGGNLIAGRTGADAYQSVRATVSRGAAGGKWYFEVLVGSSAGSIMAGFAQSTASLSNYVGSDGNGWGYNANGSTYTGSTQNSAGALSFTAGDVLVFAYDAGTGGIWFGKNGAWISSGNPATGTLQRYGVGASTVLYPMTSIFFGSTGQTMTGRFKSSDFTYSPPSGFSSWET